MGPLALKIPNYYWFKICELAKPWLTEPDPNYEEPMTYCDIIKLLVCGLLMPF